MRNTEELAVFAERLTRTREERGLSRKEIAEACGVNLRAFATYERNENKPQVAVLAKICDVLNVSADYLLGLTDQPDRATPDPDLRPEQLRDAAAITSTIYSIAEIDKAQPYVRNCLPVIRDIISRLQELQLEAGISYDDVHEEHPDFTLQIYTSDKERRKLRAAEGFTEGLRQFAEALRQIINDAAVEIADTMIVDLFDELNNTDGGNK